MLVGLAAAFDYNGLYFEKLLKNIFYINDKVIKSPSYVFERWLAIAVSTTIVLNIIFYGTNLLSAIALIAEGGMSILKRIGFLLIFFPIISLVAGAVLPWYFLQYFFSAPEGLLWLEYATALLILLFVLYDLFMLYVGKNVPVVGAAEVKRAALIFLRRVDIPILVAFAILFVFCNIAIDSSNILKSSEQWAAANKFSPLEVQRHGMLILNSFVAGAAAFKLAVSNLLFTNVMIEMLPPKDLNTAAVVSE